MKRFWNGAQLLGTLGWCPLPGPHGILSETSKSSTSSQNYWLFYYPILCSARLSLSRKGDGCQGTLIFSFHSATFHFTSPDHSSKMSTIISEHLWASPSTTLSSHYPLLFFPLSFPLLAFLISPLMDFNGLLWTPYQQPLCLFSSSFLFPFSYVTMFHLYFWGLNFSFTYSHRLPPSRSLSFSLRISCWVC